jgi:hypothetical protein
MIIVRETKHTRVELKTHSVKDYDDVYDDSNKLCHYCHRHDRGSDKQLLKFGPPSLNYFDKGRSNVGFIHAAIVLMQRSSFVDLPHTQEFLTYIKR